MANANLKLIRKDELIEKLQAEIKKENDMRLAIVDEIICCKDAAQMSELKAQNVVHTAIINTLEDTIRGINEQPVVQLMCKE